jgi:hypothetical protein
MYFFFRGFLFAKSGLSLFFFPCLPPSVAIVFVFLSLPCTAASRRPALSSGEASEWFLAKDLRS